MSTMAWNCRGLGNRRTVRAFEKVMSSEDPSFIFLMETKLVISEMDGIKDGLNRSQWLVVLCKGRSGGLALLWKKELKVDVQSFSDSHIDAIVDQGVDGKQWRITGFYGNLETSKRQESWLLLKRLSSLNSLPWVCLGNYNKLMDSSEKGGGCTRPAKQMEAFCDAINTCNLRDMGYSGQDFTWSRRLGSRGWVRERLDRALVSTNWAARFSKMQLHHKPNSASDHCVLILKDIQQKSKCGRRKKMFRFEEMWLKDEACVRVVEDAWDRGMNKDSFSPLSSCLDECRLSLSAWNNNSFGHVGKKLVTLQARLEVLEGMRGSYATLEEIECTRTEINNLLDTEEIMWRHRSRICWLKHGDKNISFFHTKASSRYNRNTIHGVLDDSGSWQSEDEGIAKSFVDYFGSLFTTSNPVVSEELIQAIQRKVTDPMNALLTRNFQATEVDFALKHMYRTTASGPDGMPPIFYQKFWPKVRL